MAWMFKYKMAFLLDSASQSNIPVSLVILLGLPKHLKQKLALSIGLLHTGGMTSLKLVLKPLKLVLK